MNSNPLRTFHSRLVAFGFTVSLVCPPRLFADRRLLLIDEQMRLERTYFACRLCHRQNCEQSQRFAQQAIRRFPLDLDNAGLDGADLKRQRVALSKSKQTLASP